MNTQRKLYMGIVLAITVIAVMFANAQAQTLGFNADLSAGSFDQTGNAAINLNTRTILFTAKQKQGFNIFTHANMQFVLEKPMFAFGALGVGYRIPIRNKTEFPSFVEIGIGMGVQTTPKPELIQTSDTTWREINKHNPMRGIGYVNGQFSIPYCDHDHPLMFQTQLDLSFDPMRSDVEFTYRYRASVVFQPTHFPSDINLIVGLDADNMLTHGVTAGLNFDRNRIQLRGIFGYQYNMPQPGVTGGFRFELRL